MRLLWLNFVIITEVHTTLSESREKRKCYYQFSSFLPMISFNLRWYNSIEVWSYMLMSLTKNAAMTILACMQNSKQSNVTDMQNWRIGRGTSDWNQQENVTDMQNFMTWEELGPCIHSKEWGKFIHLLPNKKCNKVYSIYLFAFAIHALFHIFHFITMKTTSERKNKGTSK